MSKNNRVNPDQTDGGVDEEKSFTGAKQGGGNYSRGGSSSSLRLLQIAVLLLAIVLIIIIIVFAVLISRRPQYDEIEKINYNRNTIEIQEGGKFGSLYSTKSGSIGVGLDNPTHEFDVLGDIHAYGDIYGSDIVSNGKIGALGGISVGLREKFFVDEAGRLALNHFNTSLPLKDQLSVNGTASVLGELRVGGTDGLKINSGGISNVGTVDMKAGVKNLVEGGVCSGRGFQVDLAGDVYFCKASKLYKICCYQPV